jgi:hypothetical protein
LLWALVVAGCAAERIVTPLGRGVIQMPRTTLAVGEEMTVVAGVLYRDGRFEPWEDAAYSASPASVVQINPSTGLVRGTAQGQALIVATLPGVTQIDTTITITAP